MRTKTMEKRDFFDRFIGLLGNTREKYELDSIHDTLIVWFGENYLSLDPQEVKARVVKDAHAEGIDSILLDQIGYELVFAQAQTVETFDGTERNFPETKIKETLEGARFLLKGVYKGKITPELENLVDEYHELDKTGDYKTKILFLTLKRKPVDYKFVENFKQEFPEIEVHFYDFDWLHDFYENRYLAMRAAPPEKISFKVITRLLPKDDPHKSRVFTCKGEELARIYNDYKERIFQQNVRYSLGLRSKSINRQIYETAIDDAKSTDFWYFNNGITIVCDEINEATSGRVINLKNAQIINGAQTTYALFEGYQMGTLKDEVEVLIKAIESTDRDFIESVTLYTNSQNAIRLRDLCSNDEIQVRIQKILLGSYRYFYERKRGEFDSLYPTIDAKRQAFGNEYKTKVLSNETAAQAILAMYLHKPAQAKSEKGRIFLKDAAGFYESIFNKSDNIISEKILMACSLLRYIEMQKSDYQTEYKKAEQLAEDKKAQIYKYDFLLHSEYFILNIFKDFLQNMGLDVNSKKDDLLTAISKIDSNDAQIQECYKYIKGMLAEYLSELRGQLGYYHNKFFKNEKSIGLIRNFFKKRAEEFLQIALIQ